MSEDNDGVPNGCKDAPKFSSDCGFRAKTSSGSEVTVRILKEKPMDLNWVSLEIQSHDKTIPLWRCAFSHELATLVSDLLVGGVIRGMAPDGQEWRYSPTPPESTDE